MSDDAVFRALADSSRRELLDRLRERIGQTSNDLCRGLAMTRQAVAKHLAILEKAHLVSTRRQGREKLHFVNAIPIADAAEGWMARFKRPLPPLASLDRGPQPDEENGTVRKPAEPQLAADRPRLPPLSSLRSLRSDNDEGEDDGTSRQPKVARPKAFDPSSSTGRARPSSLPRLRSLATRRPEEEG